MDFSVNPLIKLVSLGIEVIGIVIISIGALLALGRFLLKKQGENFRSFLIIRKELGRAILLGLEFLVAADIINTVVFDATLENILKLGLIVLIRTFLSFALEIEIEGKLPWQQNEESSNGKK